MLALAAAFLTRPVAGIPAAPVRTFCAEWVRQSREGYERLTLFIDGNAVWKTSRGGTEEIKRRKLDALETDFYCEYFARPEFWAMDPDLRTGLTGEFARQSSVTLVRADGARKQIRFDELSASTPESAALRSSLEGLRVSFENPLAPASRFTPDALAPGTLLKRFDGEVFRIRTIEKEKGIVELEGVREPYREFRKIDELRFLFSPPE